MSVSLVLDQVSRDRNVKIVQGQAYGYLGGEVVQLKLQGLPVRDALLTLFESMEGTHGLALLNDPGTPELS